MFIIAGIIDNIEEANQIEEIVKVSTINNRIREILNEQDKI